jgi:hypothetical protein
VLPSVFSKTIVRKLPATVAANILPNRGGRRSLPDQIKNLIVGGGRNCDKFTNLFFAANRSAIGYITRAMPAPDFVDLEYA